MAREDVFSQTVELVRQALETQAEFLGAFGPAFPAIVRHDGAVELDAQRQAVGNGVRGKAFGVGAGGNGCPGNPHDRSVSPGWGTAQAAIFGPGIRP